MLKARFPLHNFVIHLKNLIKYSFDVLKIVIFIY